MPKLLNKRDVRRWQNHLARAITFSLIPISIIGLIFHVFSSLGYPWATKSILGKIYVSIGPESCLTVLAVVVSFYSIFMQIRETHRINRFNQGVAATMHCNSRYDEIIREQPKNILRSAARDADHQAARRHWRRYWGLKADQFDMYLTGLIDRDTMVNWQVSTIRHLLRHLDPEMNGKAPGGMNAADSWDQLGRRQNEANLWFVELVTELKDKAAQLSTLPYDKREEADLLSFMLHLLDEIEPIVRAWRRSSHHGNMPLEYYRATLDWSLFHTRKLTTESKKRLKSLQDGKAVLP